MLGWMDDEALHRTLTAGRVTFWSRSRQEYWRKGDTSGHVQVVRSVALDCDGDALLVRVHQVGAACHTGTRTCFEAGETWAPSSASCRPHPVPRELPRDRIPRRRTSEHDRRPGRHHHRPRGRARLGHDVARARRLPRARPLRRVVPVVRRLLADDVTPVGLYRTLAQGRPGTFVLESAESDGRWARYSFVGVASRATLTARDGRAVWSGDVPAGVPREGDVVDVLEATLDVLRTPAVDGLPPLTGGLAGAIGWDVIRHWEPTLPSHAPDELGVPELTLCLATDLAVVDHAEGSVWLVANAINFDDTDERVDEAYADAVRRLDAMQARLVAGGAHVASVVAADAVEPELEVPLDARRVRGVRRGGQGRDPRGRGLPGRPLPAPGPRLPGGPARRVSGAAHDQPEPVHVLLPAHGRRRARLRGRRVEPGDAGQGRGRAGHDVPHRGLAAARRDARGGRRARGGAARGPQRSSRSTSCSSTSRATTSSRSANRRRSRSWSYWRPSGSATSCTCARRSSARCATARRRSTPSGPRSPRGRSGAPKPRAIALIDELEPASRGIYGGTAGYFDFDGNMDMAIAIRTALIRDGRASVQAGAGSSPTPCPRSSTRSRATRRPRQSAPCRSRRGCGARVSRPGGPARRTAIWVLLLLGGATLAAAVPTWLRTTGATALDPQVDVAVAGTSAAPA